MVDGYKRNYSVVRCSTAARVHRIQTIISRLMGWTSGRVPAARLGTLPCPLLSKKWKMHYHRHKCLIDSVVEMDIFRTKSALIRPPRILTLAIKETLSGKLLGMLQMGTLIIFMLQT